MNELLSDFLTETNEQLEAVGSQLVLFERTPSDAHIISGIYRLVHTIKGTCGFLGLTRLQALTHAAEGLIGRLREGERASTERVTLILAAVDRIRFVLSTLEGTGAEPTGDDDDLIQELEMATLSEGSRRVQPERREAEPRAEEASRAHSETVDSAARSASIRVAVGALEKIMTLVSELVLTRNQLLEITRHRDDESLKGTLQRLSSLTSDLQDGVMRARMQPIGRLFANLPRLVRELASELGKKIELVTQGSETELDRQLVELIRDPLTHMIRNAADHGLEKPDERRALGKPETGVIRIAASHEAGHITIEISDDGRGLDLDGIRRKAEKLGLASADELARIHNDDLCRYVFAPGFSTADKVTNVSGRGIGMDVVRENVESIGGTVGLSTAPGKGAVFTLKIPLTLAIAPALIIETAAQKFAIPQHAVVEAVTVGGESESKIQNVQGALVMRLRDEVIPIADLRKILGLTAQQMSDEALVVVMRVGPSVFGLLVEQVSDVQEIVVKPLGRSLAHLTLFSGNTILGDGSVVLILDPSGLAHTIGFNVSGNYAVTAAESDLTLGDDVTRMILFRDAEGVRCALPLSLIARIESVERSAISRADGKFVMQYQGKLMPIVALGGGDIDFEDARPVLVIGVGAEPMGVMVSEIVDVLEERLDIQIAGAAPGILGAAIVRGEPTQILDAAHFMKIARPGAFLRGHARRFRILIVDDKQFFRDMLAPIVAAAGYDVCTAPSARDALTMISKGVRIDAILTDIDMPEMDGYAFAKALLDDKQRADIPILALDAHASSAVQAAAQAAGMRGACGKFDRASLLSWLGDVLDSQAFKANAVESRVIVEEAA